jgi:hypothetical protein
MWAEAIACYSLCTGAAEARVEARADVAGARERLCTRLSLMLNDILCYHDIFVRLKSKDRRRYEKIFFPSNHEWTMATTIN